MRAVLAVVALAASVASVGATANKVVASKPPLPPHARAPWDMPPAGVPPQPLPGPSVTERAAISVDPATQRLVDGDGREVFFHGANVVVKSFPWAPETGTWTWDTSFNRKDWALFQQMGLNAIRLGTMWPGAEPTRGAYNQTYLDTLADIVAGAAEYGVHSLLDMHQDVLSDKFCGEGAPLWAAVTNVSNFPWPVAAAYTNQSSQGVPTNSECHKRAWAEYYFAEATATAFGNLYGNAFGLRDAWAGFWGQVARTVVARALGGAVLGYELINEPFAGDIYKDPLLMVPGVADREQLQPAYEVVQATIRAVDTDHAVFFEGVTWDWFNVGFSEVPGGAAWRNKSVLSYHLYFPLPDFSLPVQYQARVWDMERLQCGGMLTEFAIAGCNGCGHVNPAGLMDAADERKQSWLFWEYKPFVGDKTGHSSSFWFANGTLNVAAAKLISRTYPMAVAGHVQNINYTAATAAGKAPWFQLTFTTDASVRSATTEIFLNEALQYPNGVAASAAVSANAPAGFHIVLNTSVTNRVYATVAPFPPPSGVNVTIDVYE